jgi:uncharacterized protein
VSRSTEFEPGEPEQVAPYDCVADLMDPRIINKRERIQEIARKYHARNLRIFGSQLRGVERSDSDVDFLVDFDEPNLLVRIAMKHELQDELGMTVDLLTEKSLHPLSRDKILRESQTL